MFFSFFFFFFFFNDPATTEIYTLSLHDALPILHNTPFLQGILSFQLLCTLPYRRYLEIRLMISGWGICRYTYRSFRDRKSTRLNSSHVRISYAVFCLKKKKKKYINLIDTIY